MSLPSVNTPTTRKTRANHIPSIVLDSTAIFDELHRYIHSLLEFKNVYNHYDQSNVHHRSILISNLCRLLTIENFDNEILLFILDRLIISSEYISEIQFKQEIFPFIKQILINHTNNHILLLSIIRLLLILVTNRSNILHSTIAEWLSCLLNFLVLNLSTTTYNIYGDLLLDLLEKIIEQFIPLSKDLVDILIRSASGIISPNFLQQLKFWIKNNDDIRLGLFSIRLWQYLAAFICRLLVRGHSKGNEFLAVMEDAFIVSNYSIRSAAFTTWSNFILNIQKFDENEIQQLNSRLLKLFLSPFLTDSTSKSKSASISKCHAWIILISIYPQNVYDVILPFLAFAFGNHLSSTTIATTTAWWSECRQIGGQYLYDLLVKNIHGEYVIKLAADQILNYLFDSIIDQCLEYSVNSIDNIEDSLWLKSWNGYLNHLMNILQINHSINEEQRVKINTCLLTRIEQLWIDSRIQTRCLLKLFETFEQISFPLAIETVLRDSSIRTKTLSSAQIHPTLNNSKSQDKSSLHYRTTLSDQYLHMMLEHAIRFHEDDPMIENSYLHILTYLIETLSKTSDENFSYQTSLLLLKCSVEYSHQPLTIPSLFWHIWFRCSTHLINILNRSHTFELNNKIDNQKQETSIELLLRPFAFNDIERLDYSYTLLWIQLFKAICRLTLMNYDHLIDLILELLRNEPAFQQAIHDQHNQRLFGWILIIIKTLMKTFADIDHSTNNNTDRTLTNNFIHLFPTTQKRSSSSIYFCLTQFTIIINHILQRLLSNNHNNTQYSLVCHCLSKSTKISSNEQSKSFVFTYIRDLLVDLLNLCKIYSHFEMILNNLNQLLPFLYLSEQSIHSNLSVIASPNSKQPLFDNTILNKLLTIITNVFEPSNSSSLLQLIYPILILAFQHSKTIVRNKARKCWNETFGRMTFIVYPNELRICLRDLKDKEHLLLPCFLADHDNSNTAGSGPIPSSTDESQLSQQIDIPTPFISSMVQQQQQQQQPKSASPNRFIPPSSASRSISMKTEEPIFVPIIQNSKDSPVTIGKRFSSMNSCLTENQKEKLRTRQAIPLLCDENSNTQSNSYTVDLTNNDQQSKNRRLTTGIPLFQQSIVQQLEENQVSPIKTKNNEEIPSITKKLRRSCRPSLSARKSLINHSHKKLSTPPSDELISNSPSISDIITIEKPPIKSILKRLSPTKPRQDRSRRVAFHDQVKVLVFASPSRRNSFIQEKKKNSNRDEIKSPTRIIPKENLPLRKQPMSARRLSVMNISESTILPSPVCSTKVRSSKLFHPNDAIVDWMMTESSMTSNENQVSLELKSNDPIFPSLIDCEKPIECLMNILYDGLCPTDTLTYFHSNKIITIGDIARSTAHNIENYPIPSPKLINIQKALEDFAKNNISPIILTTTSEETISSSNPLSSKIEITITNSENKLYDVDRLINDLDYEKLHLHDETPICMNQMDFKRPRRQLAIINQEDIQSPQKRALSPTNDICPIEDQYLTLGDRLQKAAEIYKIKGKLPFDDDYIELVRQLIENSSLTHLEQLHLKTRFFNH